MIQANRVIHAIKIGVSIAIARIDSRESRCESPVPLRIGSSKWHSRTGKRRMNKNLCVVSGEVGRA